MQLLNDRVLVRRRDEDEQTSSGLFIANMAPTFIKGEVLEVGNGLLTQHGERIALTVQKGDTILFTPAGALDYEGDLLVTESTIAAIL